MRFEYKHFAFLGVESQRAAEASECANEQDMFWPYHDTIFLNQRGENQGFWSQRVLEEFAVKLGMDEAAFSECMDEGRYGDAIQAAYEVAGSRGVDHTPTVYVNGEEVPSGAPLEVYIQMIEAALGR